MYLVGIHFFASGNAPFPRVHLFAKFSSDILDAVGCRSSLGRDEGVGVGGGRVGDTGRTGQPPHDLMNVS